MKKQVQTGIIMGLMLLVISALAQEPTSIDDSKMVETHLDLLLNLVGTNLNYGNSNHALADYKKSILSPQLGLSMQAGVTSHFSLVSEFYFMMKGGKLQSNNPLTIGTSTLRFYTIEMPLLARFHYKKGYVNAGPSIAYNFYGTNKMEGTTSDLSFGRSANSFRRWEAGIQFGGGYNFRIRQKRVALDLRYNYGLTNLSKADEMYNRSFILSMRFYKPWKSSPFAGNKHS